MFSSVFGSRKNRRKSAGSLRIEVQQLEVRIVPAAGKGMAPPPVEVIHVNPLGCPLEAVHGGAAKGGKV